MTKNDIIRMAKDADCYASRQTDDRFDWQIIRDERFAELVLAAEREACAKVADGELMNTNMLTSYPPKSSAAWNIAAAIRARGQA